MSERLKTMGRIKRKQMNKRRKIIKKQYIGIVQNDLHSPNIIRCPNVPILKTFKKVF